MSSEIRVGLINEVAEFRRTTEASVTPQTSAEYNEMLVDSIISYLKSQNVVKATSKSVPMPKMGETEGAWMRRLARENFRAIEELE